MEVVVSSDVAPMSIDTHVSVEIIIFGVVYQTLSDSEESFWDMAKSEIYWKDFELEIEKC